MNAAKEKSDVIPAQRHSLILELIQQKHIISVHELSEIVGVSLPTIRRDLDLLAKSGAIQRSHGGAMLKTSPGSTFEPDYQNSTPTASRAKATIGKLAVERLHDNQSVIFDSSSTVYEAAYQVVEKSLTLTAVTNDLRIAKLFAGCRLINLFVCGGTIRQDSFTLVGEPGTSFLKNLHVDVALLGIHAIHNACCSETSPEIAVTKQLMVSAAKRVIILADASKLGRVAFIDAFDVDDRFEIITNSPVAASIHKELLEKGVQITIAV